MGEEEEVGPKTLKDVPAKDFVRAYAEHLRSTGKVSRGASRRSEATH